MGGTLLLWIIGATSFVSSMVFGVICVFGVASFTMVAMALHAAVGRCFVKIPVSTDRYSQINKDRMHWKLPLIQAIVGGAVIIIVGGVLFYEGKPFYFGSRDVLIVTSTTRFTETSGIYNFDFTDNFTIDFTLLLYGSYKKSREVSIGRCVVPLSSGSLLRTRTIFWGGCTSNNAYEIVTSNLEGYPNTTYGCNIICIDNWLKFNDGTLNQATRVTPMPEWTELVPFDDPVLVDISERKDAVAKSGRIFWGVLISFNLSLFIFLIVLGNYALGYN